MHSTPPFLRLPQELHDLISNILKNDDCLATIAVLSRTSRSVRDSYEPSLYRGLVFEGEDNLVPACQLALVWGACTNSIPVMVQAMAYGAALDKQVKFPIGQMGNVKNRSPVTEYAWDTALQIAAFIGHVDAVQWLLDQGADINGVELESPSCSNCHCSGGNDPPTGNRSILHLTVCAGHLSILRTLLERGASLDVAEQVDNEHIIHAALYHGWISDDLTFLEAILDHLATSTTNESEKSHALDSVSKDRLTPLQFTIDRGESTAMLEALTMLVRAGASLKTPPCSGHSGCDESVCSSLLLYSLSHSEISETFHLLLDLGADINGDRPGPVHTNPHWQSPLHFMVNQFEGVDINPRFYRNWESPQERSNRHREVVGRLVGLGASLDIQDAEGRTPLMHAMSYGAEHFPPQQRMRAMKLVKTMLENAVQGQPGSKGGVSEESRTRAEEWIEEVSRSLEAEKDM